MKNTYVKDLKKGLTISNENFLLVEAEKAIDKNGSDYYKVTVADKTGKVEAKIWGDKLANIDRDLLIPGTLLCINCRVEEFRGIPQLNITDAILAEDADMDDFLETSAYSPDEMMDELLNEIQTIQDPKLKHVVLSIITDEENNKKLKFWPAGKSVHHEFRSGLLQHILEMLEIKRSLMRFYPEINYDVLTAGVILHDIGKLEELDSSNIGANYSTKGMLMGHINLGVIIFTKFADSYLDEGTYNHVCHLILSHHGSLEYGSPVLPSTTEAVILSNIDNLSSKARSADSATNRIMEGQEFSDYNRWLGGVKIWKSPKFQVTSVEETPEGIKVSLEGNVKEIEEELGITDEDIDTSNDTPSLF
jgi:3'-5' exoribonuclease